MHLVPFYGQEYEKQKWPGTSYQSVFGLQNMFRKNPFLKIYYLSNIVNLIQSGVWVVSKIAFANLCKPVHDVRIILISSDPLNLETVERKEQIQGNEYHENEKSCLHEIKSILNNFWNAFLCW